MTDVWTPPRPKPVSWRVEYYAYRGMEFAIGLLPGGFAARMGAALGAMGYHFLSKRRQTVLRNLRIAFAGEKTMAEIHELAREVFRRTGANLVASLHTATIDRAGLAEAMEVVGLEKFQAAVREGHGVVAVLAHMGNWEAMAQQFPFLIPEGFKGATVYRPLNNPLLNARVEATRARAGTALFSKKDSPLAMMAFLREGGALGLLSDQRAGNTGELIPFMGRLTSCTPLPSIFARRTHARVLGVSITTLKPGRWRLAFHELKGEPTTVGCMALLEEIIRTSPADVFWLQERWRTGRRNPLLLEGKPSRDSSAPVATKYRRVLVWLDPVPAAEPALPPSEQPDIVYEFMVPSPTLRPEWVAADARLHVRGSGDYAEALRKADEAETLPLDVVLLTRENTELMRACQRVGIRGFLCKPTATP
ncbi:MAG: lipid A biosynthesis acyltransferase [Opitutaceae bacterium]|jgi:KDO2-lipid IV(A) lauroyltransferase